jgi:propanediol dehydratase small subunit
MKQLLDEKTLLEILDLARDFEQSTREMCEMSTTIAHKYQKRVAEFRQVAADKIGK